MVIPEDQYRMMVSALPIVCVDVLIIFEGKCLLLKRDNEPAKGQYWFPGGRILKNETIAAAALRKAKEETNLDCVFVSVVSTEESIFENKQVPESGVHTVNICCRLTTSSIDNISIDHLHNGMIWVDKVNDSYHTAVKNPLSILGYNQSLS